MLTGYKTYLVALGMLAYNILGYLLGHTQEINVQQVLEAVGLAALRAGVGKVRT